MCVKAVLAFIVKPSGHPVILSNLFVLSHPSVINKLELVTTKGLSTVSPPIMVLRFSSQISLSNFAALVFVRSLHNTTLFLSLSLSQLSGETRDVSPAMDHYQTDTSSATSTRGQPIDVEQYFYYEKERGHKKTKKPN